MNTLKHLTKALVVLLAFTFFAPASLAASEFSDGFAVMPKNPNEINKNRFIFELKPGETVKDEILIRNNSSSEEVFSVYTLGEEASKWIIIDSPQIPVKANSYAVVSFSMKAPQNTNLQDYNASLAVEKSNRASSGIIVNSRILLGVDLKVTETPNPPKKLFKEASFLEKINPLHLALALVLFLLSGGYLVFAQIKGKK